MSELKLDRGVVILVGILMLGLFFILIPNQLTSTNAAAITPPPRTLTPEGTTPPTVPPTPENGGPRGAIIGRVIDLSTGQPGQGLEIEFSGRVVRTDHEGRYSLTGLETGTYIAILRVPNGMIAAQDPLEVYVVDPETVTLNLDFYSQPPPALPPGEAPANCPSTLYYEENDSQDQACGPLIPGQAYDAYPEDLDDWYFFVLNETSSVSLQVTNYTALGQLVVYRIVPNKIPPREAIASDGRGLSVMEIPNELSVAALKDLPVGTYYVRIYSSRYTNTVESYRLILTLNPEG